MRHHKWIDLWIGQSISQDLEVNAASRPLFYLDDAAPFGGRLHDAYYMLRRGDECEFLETLAVDIDLCREPVEIVLSALNFIAVDTAIDHRHVNAAPSVRETKLVDHKRAGIGLGAPQSLGVERRANVCICRSQLH